MKPDISGLQTVRWSRCRIVQHVAAVGWVNLFALATVLTLAMPQLSNAQNSYKDRPVHIALLLDGPWRFGQDPRILFQREIRDLLGGEYDVVFDSAHTVYADWTADGIRRAVDRLLHDPTVDVLITAGDAGSLYVAEIAQTDRLPFPVIAPAVLDAELAGLSPVNGGSGIANLTYLNFPNTVARDLRKFKEIVDFSHVTMLAAKTVELPKYGERLAMTSLEVDVTADVVAVGSELGDLFERLDPDVEAVYVFPLPQLPASDVRALAEELADRKIPSFSFFGGAYVEAGFLASLSPDVFERLARRVALSVADILNGVDPAEIPVTFLPGEKLQLNTGTARTIGVYPNWDIIVEAEVIFDLDNRVSPARQLSLATAVQEAITANLEILAQDRVLAAGAWDVKRARSSLLPQVTVSATGLTVDKNLAESSFGTQAERSLTTSATLTQVLYNESAVANLEVEQHLQAAREFDRESLLLDVALDVATAYLNLLKAKTLEQVEFENVKLTRSNLDLARVREQLGQSGPAEVLRWEAQIATNRKDQMLASARRRAAEVVVNQLLNRPLEEPFDTIETLGRPDDPEIVKPYVKYVDNPQLFQIFRDFLVGEGLAGSPELKAFDEVIASQERVHEATKRAFWIPDIALQAATNTNLAKGGAGSSGPSVSLPIEFPEANDTHWNLGINLKYPLFTGLSRKAARAAASERLAQLRTERALSRNLVEQRIRTTLELTGGSHGAISQSRKAAEAAAATLSLVTDAYARGAVTILDLLDAQNAALVTRSAAATAVYDFLLNLMTVHRAVGRFDFLASDQEKAVFLGRLDQYFRDAGIEVRPKD